MRTTADPVAPIVARSGDPGMVSGRSKGAVRAHRPTSGQHALLHPGSPPFRAALPVIPGPSDTSGPEPNLTMTAASGSVAGLLSDADLGSEAETCGVRADEVREGQSGGGLVLARG